MFNVECHSGDLSYRDRERLITKFQLGQTKFIAATDVLQYGINGYNIRAVVNVELALGQEKRPDMKRYYHRVARCDRFGNPAVAISFGTSEQIKEFGNIQKHIFKL
ncbi:ATP-dependent RNA helicase DBP5-like [Contarinia nasturtii]|uniref:ATP-dependent RNA helicase DBP5-like n=1 Tax=Contarinia nasturtii TaxID=265458 RepID=UPI0012D3E9EE|nr:ATP-dependent RNA helicase DBP5-like [Contarinia nasturtii]